MKRLRHFLLTVFMGTCLVVEAQTHSTKETKVVLVVSPKTETVTHIVLFNTFEKLGNDEVEAIYPNSQFYIGLLTGRYTLDQKGLQLGRQTSIVMYTNRQFFKEEPFLSEKNLALGEQVDVGNTTARIVSSKKGELTLRTQ